MPNLGRSPDWQGTVSLHVYCHLRMENDGSDEGKFQYFGFEYYAIIKRPMIVIFHSTIAPKT